METTQGNTVCFFTKTTDFIIGSFQKIQVSKSLFIKNDGLALILFQKISNNFEKNFTFETLQLVLP